MKPTHVSILKLSAFAATLLTAPAAFAGLIVGAPVDVVGNLPLATFVGNNFATQSYKDWGNEPFVAVNPTNTNDIVVSSFAFETPRNSQASIFYSTNGGTSWTLQKTIPPPSVSVGVPRDCQSDLARRLELHRRRGSDQHGRITHARRPALARLERQ